MLDMFFGAVCVGLVLFALLTLSYGAFLKFAVPKNSSPYFLVIPVHRSEEDFTTAACAARVRLGLLGDDACGAVVFLDCGMDKTQKMLCENLCDETKGIYYCDYKSFKELTK